VPYLYYDMGLADWVHWRREVLLWFWHASLSVCHVFKKERWKTPLMKIDLS